MELATKTVDLSKPVTVFGKTYNKIVMREPNTALYFELGPMTANYRSGAIESTLDLPGVLSSYLGRCVTNVEDPQTAIPALLVDLPLVDGVRLRRRFTEFFSEAVEKVLAEETLTLLAAKGKGASGVEMKISDSAAAA